MTSWGSLEPHARWSPLINSEISQACFSFIYESMRFVVVFRIVGNKYNLYPFPTKRNIIKKEAEFIYSMVLENDGFICTLQRWFIIFRRKTSNRLWNSCLADYVFIDCKMSLTVCQVRAALEVGIKSIISSDCAEDSDQECSILLTEISLFLRGNLAES